MSNKQNDIQNEIYKGQIKGSKFIEGTGSSLENIAQAYKEYKENLLNTDEENINLIATSTDGVNEDLKNEFENNVDIENVFESDSLSDMDSTGETSNIIKTSNILVNDEKDEKNNPIKTSVANLKQQEGGTSSTSPLQMIKTSTLNNVYDRLFNEDDDYDFEEDYSFDNDLEDSSLEENGTFMGRMNKFSKDDTKLKTQTEKSKLEKVGSGVKKVGKATESVTRTQRKVSAIQTSVEREDAGKEFYKTTGKEYLKKKVKKSKPVTSMKRKGTSMFCIRLCIWNFFKIITSFYAFCYVRII